MEHIVYEQWYVSWMGERHRDPQTQTQSTREEERNFSDSYAEATKFIHH